jgi:hypothetical protein
MIDDQLLPLLDSMGSNLERGAFSELKFQIDFYRPHVMAGENADLVNRFLQICDTAQAGIEYENEHGCWSLLKLDHPVTVWLHEQGFYKKLFSEAS